MRILYFVKVHFFKNFEKFVACAAALLIAVSFFQGMCTMSFNGKSASNVAAASVVSSESKVKGNVNKIGKGKKSGNNKNKSKVKKKFKINKKSSNKKKSKNRKKSKAKKKSNTYKKVSCKEQLRLNSAVLKPKEFLKGKNDKILKKHLNKIIDDDMSNYKKAKTCYDYLINNTHYAYGGWGNAVESVLEKGYGTCTEYSYVYMAMMKYLGFNAKTVDGSTAMAAGGYGYHMWTEVRLNGNTYVFDPQVEDDMTNGKINYYRFCKTYSEVPGAYIK